MSKGKERVVKITEEHKNKECLGISVMLEGGVCFGFQKGEIPAEYKAEYNALAESAKALASKIG
ncbi:hypothetical protein EPO05_03230 [Patescibacteria group bacterium]|nr:MAG: hypothetical protein EPO05_03230 [Patescibacteria group bacterium]